MWELNLFRKNVESKKEELLKKSFEKRVGLCGCGNKTFWKKVLSKRQGSVKIAEY